MINVLDKTCVDIQNAKHNLVSIMKGYLLNFAVNTSLIICTMLVTKVVLLDGCKTNPCYGYELKHPIYCETQDV